jgi:hypothetical protein
MLLGAAVAEKRCSYKGRSFSKIEYESLAVLARERSVPLIELMDLYVRENLAR